jgi:hypothetical protein
MKQNTNKDEGKGWRRERKNKERGKKERDVKELWRLKRGESCIFHPDVADDRSPLWSSGQSSWLDSEVPGSIPVATRFSEK